jgi:hypothetical protein
MTESEIEGLLDTLAEAPATMATLAEGLSDLALRQRSAADEFSFVETACHLRDLEREAYTIRIERLLTETEPQMADFDGAAAAAERNYQAEDFGVAMTEFTEARSANGARLRGLTPEQFARSGEFIGEGTFTLGQMLEMMREHDQIHRGDLKVLRLQLTRRSGAAG